MYEIGKTYRASSTHRLHGLPDGHPCARPHGHNFEIAVSVTGRLDARGMVLDYAQLDATVGAWIEDALDHRDLGDVLAQPTAECIAALVHAEASARLPGHRIRVRVSETPGTWATYPAGGE